MKLEDIRTIAKSHSINPGKLTKAALIRSIQSGEGNTACFATASSPECPHVGCSWREDCFDAVRKGALS